MLSAADFEKALSLKPCAKSMHFFVHHLPPEALTVAARLIQRAKLSTPPLDAPRRVVDNSVLSERGSRAPKSQPLEPLVLLGMVVPKRHAKRAVTRSLLKRHIRATFGEQLRLAGLGCGGWVVRLRLPFEREKFGSAQSVALAAIMRHELTELMKRAGAVGDAV